MLVEPVGDRVGAQVLVVAPQGDLGDCLSPCPVRFESGLGLTLGGLHRVGVPLGRPHRHRKHMSLRTTCRAFQLIRSGVDAVEGFFDAGIVLRGLDRSGEVRPIGVQRSSKL